MSELQFTFVIKLLPIISKVISIIYYNQNKILPVTQLVTNDIIHIYNITLDDIMSAKKIIKK